MELKEGKKHTGGLRRPFGVAGKQLLQCPSICLSNAKVSSTKYASPFSGGAVKFIVVLGYKNEGSMC